MRLDEVPKPTHEEWFELGQQVDRSFLETLRSLSEEEWQTPTVCSPWTVKDVVAHLIGWNEAVLSPTRLMQQAGNGWRTRKDHAGNWLDSTNQFQVDSLATAPPDRVLARFAELTPRFHKVRRRYGRVTAPFPMKEPFSGTWVPLRFMFDTIFVRDHFMHHSDVCAATGRDLPVGDAEKRIAHDAFREWAKKAGASVTLDLTGPAGGTFVRGTGETRIRGDAIELCRVLAGRSSEALAIEGDMERAQGWLKVLAAF